MKLKRLSTLALSLALERLFRTAMERGDKM